MGTPACSKSAIQQSKTGFCASFLRVLVALWLLYGASYSAAQNILIASDHDLGEAASRVVPLFSANPGHNVTAELGSLAAGETIPTPDFSGYDIVVIHATYEGLGPEDVTAIIDAVNAQASTAFLFFLDGCCSNNSAVLQQILEETMISPPAGMSVGARFAPGYRDFNLNLASPYSSSFTILDPMRSAYYGPFNGFPSENILYTDSLVPSSVLSIIVPLAESKGSCMFMSSDSNMFSPTAFPTNDNIVEAFVDAATNPEGSCFRSVTGNAVTAVDDSAELDSAGGTIAVLANDSEILTEGLQLSATGTDTTSANGGTVVISGDVILYTPPADFTGEDTFSYEVCVPSGACATALVTVTVTAAVEVGVSQAKPVPSLPLFGLILSAMGILGVAAGTVRKQPSQ